MQNARYSCRILMKFEISRQIFSHISWKSVQWEPRYPMRLDGLTNRQLDVTKLIVAFRNSVNAPKNLLFPYKAGTFLNIGTTAWWSKYVGTRHSVDWLAQ